MTDSARWAEWKTKLIKDFKEGIPISDLIWQYRTDIDSGKCSSNLGLKPADRTLTNQADRTLAVERIIRDWMNR